MTQPPSKEPPEPKPQDAGRSDAIELRPLRADDRDRLVDFADALAPHDRMFLRRDITRPEVIDAWLGDIESGAVRTLVAVDEERILGYATLDRSRLDWSPHVAELRVAVRSDCRGQGLGRRLTEQAFRTGLELGIEKMVARMTLDQSGAIAVFESLGFRPEALLKNHVKDRDGNKHDLMVLSHDVAEFHSALHSYGVGEALGV